MVTRWFPCCCCVPFFEDDFNRAGPAVGADWTVSAGTWVITSNELDTSSSSGLIVSDTAEPDAKSQHVIDVKIKGDTDGDQARIILPYTDTNNYLYAQVEFGTCGELKFFQNATGHSQIGLTYKLQGFTKDTWHSVRVCYMVGTYPVAGKLSFVWDNYVYSVEVDTTGTQGALGTGTVTGTVLFDDFMQLPYKDDDTCPDCEPGSGCDIFNDQFNRADSTDMGCGWVEQVGDWEIDSNEAEIASASAVMTSAVPHPRGGTGASKITVKLKGDTDGDQARVIVDYLNDDNYHFAQLEFDTVSSLDTLTIYKRSGGVNTQLDAASSMVSLNTNYEMTVCFDGNYIEANVGSLALSVSSATTAHEGVFAGLGTGTAAGIVNADDFDWDRMRSDDDPTCETCDSPELFDCPLCEDDTPPHFKLVIAGVTGAGGCTTQCEDNFNRTYLMVNYTFCAWESATGVFTAPCTAGGGPAHTVGVGLNFAYDIGLNKSVIRVTISLDDDPQGHPQIETGHQWYYEQTGKMTCADIANLDIPYVENDGEICDSTNSTATLTAI